LSSGSPGTARPRCSRPSRRRATPHTRPLSFSSGSASRPASILARAASRFGRSGLPAVVRAVHVAHLELDIEGLLALVDDGGGALRRLAHHRAFLVSHHLAVLVAVGLAPD